MAEGYDVTIVTVRPGTHPQALAVLGKSLADDRNLLACWYSDIGAVNQILIIRKPADAVATLDARFAALSAPNPLGISEYIVAMAMDTYVAFDFIPPLRPGEFGPCYEVRSYVLKPDGLKPTMEAWRKAVPGRMKISPVLAAMTSVTRRGDALSAHLALQELRRARPPARQGGGRRRMAAARRPRPSGVAAGRYLFAGAVLADEIGSLPPARKQPVRSEPRAVAQA